MPSPIEEYALIGDCETAALVGRDGSVDWLCWPRFDSDACFAGLLGAPEHGRWLLAPAGTAARVTRRYRRDTLVLETRFETAEGAVMVVDFMPPRTGHSRMVRLVTGECGQVAMRMELALRFGYGSTVPWVHRLEDGTLRAIAGPDQVVLRTPVPVRGEGAKTVAEFTLAAGETVPFVLTYAPSHLPIPDPVDPAATLDATERFWTEWSGRARIEQGEQRDAVMRSLITLEVMDALYQAQRGGLASSADAWALQQAFLAHLAEVWREPDRGIWESRQPPRHFTFSKVVAWVAFDRAVKLVKEFDLPGPVQRWGEIAQQIHDDVCANGFDSELGSFVQSYGSKWLDGSLLLIPTTGFLPLDDPRIAGTVRAIEGRLLQDGFVMRHDPAEVETGLAHGEGAFLACSFWLADAMVVLGREDEGRRLFKRLLDLCNDVGLLSEQYDVPSKRLVGNFPQAFSHIALVNTAHNLVRPEQLARQRTDASAPPSPAAALPTSSSALAR